MHGTLERKLFLDFRCSAELDPLDVVRRPGTHEPVFPLVSTQPFWLLGRNFDVYLVQSSLLGLDLGLLEDLLPQLDLP